MPGQEIRKLKGDYVTAVFEGPYAHTPKWEKDTAAHLETRGKHPDAIYFYYMACHRCAAVYGQNYVVGVAKINCAPWNQR